MHDATRRRARSPGIRRRSLRPLFLALCLAVAAGCADGGNGGTAPPPGGDGDGESGGPPPDSDFTCRGEAPGAVHPDTEGSVWRREDGPHVIERDLVVGDELTIEAGVTVCAAADAGLAVRFESGLAVAGTEDAPVVFMPVDGADGWGGIEVSGLLARASISNAVIRGAAPSGIRTGLKGDLALTDVRIEDSAGLGLDMSGTAGGPFQLSATRVRITGSGSYPALLRGRAAQGWLTEEGAQERLLGNARDTVIVVGFMDDVVIGPDLPWRVALEMGSLRLEPGATLAVEHFSAGRLVAEGTADRPVTFVGADAPRRLWFRGERDTVTSRIRHARLSDVLVIAEDAHALELEDATLAHSQVVLETPGSRLADVVLTDSRSPEGTGVDAAVTLAAPGLRMERTTVRGTRHGPGVEIRSRDVTLSDCAISAGAGDGVRVEVADGVEIHDCDIESNAGFGVNNLGAATVDARRNWWGDPAGPDVPAGDGVAGAVLTTDPRTVPVHQGPRPASLELSPASARVITGDTVRFDAVARDDDGEPLPEAHLIWRIAEPSLARIAPDGLVTGLDEGGTSVTILARDDTTVRRTATLTVEPGGPVFDWTREETTSATRMTAIWRAPDGDAFVVTSGGAIYRYDGTEWSRMENRIITRLVGVWGSAADDIWAVSPNGSILRSDGSGWTETSSPGPGTGLFDIWLAGRDTIFVSGAGGVWLRTDDGGWVELLQGEGAGLGDLWGRSATEVFVVDRESASVLRYDGSRWEDLEAPEPVTGIWGDDADLWAVGPEGVILRFDGDGWTAMDSGTRADLTAIHGSGPASILATGPDGAARFYDGTAWRTAWPGLRADFGDAWVADGVAYLVGDVNVVMRGQWTP